MLWNSTISHQTKMIFNTSILTTNLIQGSTHMKMSCTDKSGTQHLSNYFDIFITCGPNSVSVKTSN